MLHKSRKHFLDGEISARVSAAFVKVLVLVLELMNGATNTLRPRSRHTTQNTHEQTYQPIRYTIALVSVD